MSDNQFFDINEYLVNDDDVILFAPDSMCKMAKFKEVFDNFLASKLPSQLIQHFDGNGIKNIHPINQTDWLKDGKDCEVLNIGSNGWKKGKIRLKVTLEFVPDEPESNEPESLLDDIRQSMN